MTLPEQGDTAVEIRVRIHRASGDTDVRRGADELGIWLKPLDGLDRDGEHFIAVDELGQALRALGINRVDVFPAG